MRLLEWMPFLAVNQQSYSTEGNLFTLLQTDYATYTA